jgi:hypothetical protein
VATVRLLSLWHWYALITVPKYEPEFCLDAARKVNPSRSMLLELEQPEHSSRVVSTRPIETDQLRLLKTLHGKATGTQKRQPRSRPALGEVTLSKS